VIQQWDEILRMIATIKLKEVTASDLFRRLNSYSKQHALYRALKAFGQAAQSRPNPESAIGCAADLF
jgi:TnpA family transposase